MRKAFVLFALVIFLAACTPQTQTTGDEGMEKMQNLVDKYAQVEVSTENLNLSDTERQIMNKLIDASKLIDEIYWMQASENGLKLREELAASEEQLDKLKLHFLNINKFAYDRLDANKPFMGDEELTETGTFWPAGLTREDLDAYLEANPDEREALLGLHTVVRRDGDKLVAVPYNEVFNEKLSAAAALLKEAAELTENENFKKYLNLRAEALVTDNYFDSDMAWMDLDGKFDLVIGAIEVYEDRLMNLKSAYEAYVLVKDQAASEELGGYINSMDEMQQNLPVDDKFKQREVQLGSSVGVFTQVYGSGQSEAGSKTIAISLPNDPKVRAIKGARKVMLRNAIDAKFNKILMPIAERMIVEDQLEMVDGDLFFSNVLLHEISHSLGNDYVLDEEGNETSVAIDEALKEASTVLEECKADIGGLYSADILIEKDMMTEEERNKAYVTYTAGIFRSVRFGAASSHGVANAMSINWLKENGGLSVDENGKYVVNYEAFHAGIESLLNKVLTIQNTGDYEAAKQMLAKYGTLPADVTENLAAMTDIPVDIEFVWK